MHLFYKLLSVLFLLSIYSFTFVASLKVREKQSSAYYLIRNEYDDRCVAHLMGTLKLEENCNLGESVWKTTKGQTQNISLQNVKSEKYLSFGDASDPSPKMISTPELFHLQTVHVKNRRYPSDQKYWGITYHVIQNARTRRCLMVWGETMQQRGCNPSRPEHLSFQEVPFNPIWGPKGPAGETNVVLKPLEPVNPPVTPVNPPVTPVDPVTPVNPLNKKSCRRRN